MCTTFGSNTLGTGVFLPPSVKAAVTNSDASIRPKSGSCSPDKYARNGAYSPVTRHSWASVQRIPCTVPSPDQQQVPNSSDNKQNSGRDQGAFTNAGCILLTVSPMSAQARLCQCMSTNISSSPTNMCSAISEDFHLFDDDLEQLVTASNWLQDSSPAPQPAATAEATTVVAAAAVHDDHYSQLSFPSAPAAAPSPFGTTSRKSMDSCFAGAAAGHAGASTSRRSFDGGISCISSRSFPGVVPQQHVLPDCSRSATNSTPVFHALPGAAPQAFTRPQAASQEPACSNGLRQSSSTSRYSPMGYAAVDMAGSSGAGCNLTQELCQLQLQHGSLAGASMLGQYSSNNACGSLQSGFRNNYRQQQELQASIDQLDAQINTLLLLEEQYQAEASTTACSAAAAVLGPADMTVAQPAPQFTAEECQPFVPAVSSYPCSLVGTPPSTPGAAGPARSPSATLISEYLHLHQLQQQGHQQCMCVMHGGSHKPVATGTTCGAGPACLMSPGAQSKLEQLLLVQQMQMELQAQLLQLLPQMLDVHVQAGQP